MLDAPRSFLDVSRSLTGRAWTDRLDSATTRIATAIAQRSGVSEILARVMAYLTLFPQGVLGPLILVFSVIGTYAGANNIHAVWIMIGFGIVGYYAQRWKFSTAAMLLGLILGPIAENGFRDLMVVSHDQPLLYIAQRPIAIGVLAILMLVLFYAVKPKKWEDLEKAEAGKLATGDTAEAGKP